MTRLFPALKTLVISETHEQDGRLTRSEDWAFGLPPYAEAYIHEVVGERFRLSPLFLHNVSSDSSTWAVVYFTEVVPHSAEVLKARGELQEQLKFALYGEYDPTAKNPPLGAMIVKSREAIKTASPRHEVFRRTWEVLQLCQPEMAWVAVVDVGGQGTSDFGRALASVSEGDLTGAIADLDRAVTKESGDVGARYVRGIVRDLVGDYVGSLRDLEECARQDVLYVRAVCERGFEAARRRDLDGAIAIYDRCLEIDRSLAITWFGRGLAKADKGDMANALHDFDRSIQLDPHFARSYHLRGRVKQQLGDVDGAIADYESCLERYPTHEQAREQCVAAREWRGAERTRQGDLEGAITDFTRCLSLSPTPVYLYHYRAVARTMAGDVHGALADFDSCIAHGGSGPTHFKRGETRAAMGDLDGAIADFDRCIDAGFELAVVHYNRGRARARKTNLDGAIVDYDRCIELAPRCSEFYVNRGMAKAHKLIRALQAKTVSKLTPDIIADAMNDLERGLQLDPQNEQALFLAGWLKTQIE